MSLSMWIKQISEFLPLPLRMNNPSSNSIKVGLITTFGLISGLSAIERPGENKEEALPAEALPQFEEEKNPQNTVANKVTWLGVLSEPVSEDLAWHLKLDSGVIVRVVDPTSPAFEAGLKDRDIILKIGGLAVQTRDQVRTAITSRQPGEEVVLRVQRQGEQMDLKVTLGERETIPQVRGALRLEDNFPGLGQIIPRGMNNDDLALLQQQLLKRVEDALKDGAGGTAGLNDLLKKNIPGGQSFNLATRSSSSFSFSDDQGTVEMTMVDDERKVKVTDLDGKVLFDGPYSTEEQKNAVPAELRERIDALGIDQEDGAVPRLQFRFFGKEDE